MLRRTVFAAALLASTAAFAGSNNPGAGGGGGCSGDINGACSQVTGGSHLSGQIGTGLYVTSVTPTTSAVPGQISLGSSATPLITPMLSLLGNSVVPTVVTGLVPIVQWAPKDGLSASLQSDTFGSAVGLSLVSRASGGTGANPSATPTGTFLFQLSGFGFDTTFTGQRAAIRATTSETFAAGANGTRLDFFTTPTGSVTEADAVRIQPDGSLTVGSSSIASTAGAGGAFVSGAIVNFGITADTAQTDATVCASTSTKQFYTGTGVAGICLGTSSLRFKTLQGVVTEADAKQVLKWQPIIYRNRPGYGDDGARELVGFAAEWMENDTPRLVSFGKDGRANSVDYLGAIPYLTKLVQMQQKQIDRLQREVSGR